MKARNNPKNKQAFLDYKRKQMELAQRTEAQARKNRIKANVALWEESLPDALKMAKPAALHRATIERIRDLELVPPYNKNLLIIGETHSSTIFTAYTLAHAFIESGRITPSEVRVASLLEGYNNVNGMFQSRAWKDYFFDKDAKIFILEGASRSLSQLVSRDEVQFWRELTEFTKDPDKLIILTYNKDEREVESERFLPLLSSDNDLNRELIKGFDYIYLNEEEDKKIQYEQERYYRSL